MATGGNLQSKGSNSNGRHKSSKTYRSQNMAKEEPIRSHIEGMTNNWSPQDWRTYLINSGKKSRNRDNINGLPLTNDSFNSREHRSKISSMNAKTKYTSDSSKIRRQSNDHLRQNMTISGGEEFQLDSEPNVEGIVSFDRSTRSFSDGVNVHRKNSHHNTSKRCRKNATDLIDSNQIVCHLSQLRDYQQQVLSHREVLQSSHNMAKNRDKISSLTRLFSKLKKQEKQYLDLLKNLLTFHEDRLATAINNSDSDNSAAESTSITGDFQSEASEITTDGELNCRDRPRIEDKIDFVTQEENTPNNSERGNIRRTHSLNTPRSSQADLLAVPLRDLKVHCDVGEDLSPARENVKKPGHHPELLQSFQGRQVALEALQRRTEKKFAQMRQLQGEAGHDVRPTIQPTARDFSQRVDQVSLNLEDINHRLNMLNYLYDNRHRAESMSRSVDEQTLEESEGAIGFLSQRHDLRNKLRDMQDKKQHMDEILYELKTLRAQRVQQMNNEIETGSTLSSQIVTNLIQTNPTLQEAQELLQTLDTREKFREHELINENSEMEEESSLPALSDYEDPQLMRNLRQIQEKQGKKQKVDSKKKDNRTKQKPENSNREGSSGLTPVQQWDISQNHSSENQTTHRKSHIVNEKLRQLKELVDSVKRLPITSQSLSEDLSEITNAAESEQTLTEELCAGHEITVCDALSETEISSAVKSRITGSRFQRDQMPQQIPESTFFSLQKNLKEFQLYDHLQHNETESTKDNQRNNIRLMDVESSARENHNENLISQLNNPCSHEGTQIKKQDTHSRHKRQEFQADCPSLFTRNNQSETISLQPLLNDLPSSINPTGENSTAATWDDSTQDNIDVDEEEEEEDDESQDNDEDGEDRGYPSDSIVQAEEEEEEAYGDRDEVSSYPEPLRRSAFQKHNMPNNQPYQPNKFKSEYEDQWNKKQAQSSNQCWRSRRHLPFNRTTRQENQCSPDHLIDHEPEIRENESSQCLQQLKHFQQQLDKTSNVCQTLLREQQVMVDQMQTNFKNQHLLSPLRHPLNSADFQQQYNTYIQQQQVFYNLHQFCLQLHQQQLEMQIIQQQLNLIKNSTNSNAVPVSSNPGELNFQSWNSSTLLNPYSALNIFSPFMNTSLLTPSALNHSFPMPPQLPANISSLNNNPQVQNNISLNGSGEGTNCANATLNNLSGNFDSIIPTRGMNVSSARKLFPETKTSSAPSINSGHVISWANECPNLHGHPPSAENVSTYQHINNASLRLCKPIPRFDSKGMLKPMHKKRKREAGSSTHSDASASSKQNSGIFSIPNQNHKIANTNFMMKHIEAIPRFGSRIECQVKSSQEQKHQLASISHGFSNLSFSDNNVPHQQQSGNCHQNMTNINHNNLTVQVERESNQHCPTPLFIQTGSSPNSFYTSEKGLPNDNIMKRKPNKDSIRKGEHEVDYSSSSSDPLLQSIYAEVSSLISQNESRLHFLLEIFQALQLLNTDYLRQRSLYAIRDVVSKYIPETSSEKKKHDHLFGLAYKNNSPLNLSQPSESRPCQYLDRTNTSSSKSSTPSHHEPFADDSLGDTVIHFDQSKPFQPSECKSGFITLNPSNFCPIKRENFDKRNSPCESSSGNCISNITNAHIDTQQLSRQIRQIMMDLIPLLQEHMNNWCSQSLLLCIRRWIFALTSQRENRQDFVQFFNKQLGSILKETLNKYLGKKLQDCSEELMFDISEVLFNELAFFRLMQDLDVSDESIQDSKLQAVDFKRYARFSDDSYNNTPSVESKIKIMGGGDGENLQKNEDLDHDLSATTSELEDLGKIRDDTMAETWDLVLDKDEFVTNLCPFKMKLVKSETKSMTIIGSDEDVDSVDSQMISEPIETAVERLNDRDYVKDDYSFQPEETDKFQGMNEKEIVLDTKNEILTEKSSEVLVGGNLVDIIHGFFLSEDTKEFGEDKLVNGINVKSEQDIGENEDASVPGISLSKKQLDRKVTEESQQTNMNSLTEELLTMISQDDELAGDANSLPDPSSM